MLDISEKTLIGDLIARPTTMDDLEAVFDLEQAFMYETFGSSNQTLDGLHTEWTSPGFDVTHSVSTYRVWRSGTAPATGTISI